MKLISPILITLNNTLHIKADNLEHVEVDSSSINELLNYTKKDRLGITGNLSSGWYIDIEKGINISELSDRIEVREERILLAKSGGYREGLMIEPATFIDGKPYKVTYKAFLLLVKEDNFPNIASALRKGINPMYTIEEIENVLKQEFKDAKEFGYELTPIHIINRFKK